MKFEIDIPDTLPEGHGGSFKKGIAKRLLENAKTPIDHTPNGHEHSRELGETMGETLVQEIARIVKKPKEKGAKI